MKKIPRTLVAFFWHFLRPYRRHFSIILFLGFLWAIETSLTPYVMKQIIDHISGYEGDFRGALVLLSPFIAAYLGLNLMNCISFRFREWLLLKSIPVLRRDIWSSLFDYLLHHSHRYFQKNFSGGLANKISDMARGLEDLLTNVAEVFITQVAAVMVACVAMYVVNPLFSLILFIWATTFIIFSLWASKNAQKLAHVYSEDVSSLVGRTVDSILNITNVRMFSCQQHEARHLDSFLRANVDKDQKLQKYLLRMRAIQDVSLLVLVAILLGLLIYLYVQKKVTLGDFAFILTLSISIFNGVWYLAAELVKFPEYLGQCSQALAIVATTHEITDAPGAPALCVRRGEIKFEGVTFQYARNRNIFEEVYLTIPPGQKVGLVGFSGSGKTTFAHLILRYYDIASGQILIDDQDITQVTQNSLRDAIAFIPQDITLFHRTIMENLRYANLDASNEQVIAAAKKANAHDFIMKMEKGYNTVLSERGMKLSGGQRQRLAIARAILKDAPILILDEATSSLDAVTERKIQQSLKKLMRGKTCIVIAHRLSTLVEMDRILVFKNGMIVEDGSHEQLLRKKGYYANLWKMQVTEKDLV